MRRIASLSLMILLCLVVAGPALSAGAEKVTLEGEIQCARCTFGEKEFKTCQNVLIVEEDGEEVHYYMEKNAANTEFGDVCMKTTPARVMGSVAKKDGRLWLAATEIHRLES